MEGQILDKLEIIDRDARPVRKIIGFIPLILLWLGIVWSLFEGVSFDQKYITGLILLSISTLTYYWDTGESIVIVLSVIVLGIFGLVSFFPIELFFELGVNKKANGPKLGIDLLVLVIGGFYFILNRWDLRLKYEKLKGLL